KMMKEKRCHHHIECAVTKRKLEGIADDRPGPVRKFQSSGIQIQCNNPTSILLQQCFADITCAGSNVEHHEVAPFRYPWQKSFDGANAAEFPVDDFQLPICRRELMLRPAEVVHDLGLVGPLPESRPHCRE